LEIFILRKMTAINISLQQSQVTNLFHQGFLLHQENKLLEVEVIYKQILKIQPNHFNSLHLLGVLLAETQ